MRRQPVANRILIVDDEPNVLSSFSSLLKDEGHMVVTSASAEDALKKAASQRFDLVLLDIQLPGMSGIDFLRELKAVVSPPLVLVISGQADIPTALEAVRLGAVDFLEKPVQPEKLIAGVNSSLQLAAAERQRHLMVEAMDDRSRIIGESKAIRGMLGTVSQVAPTETTVLITGENGTGKELVATRIFLESARRTRPFVKVNCPGIPESLFESELFGHIKGAFTGAVKDYPGKFAMADGGTIFLDEIGDLPANCQAKLLRVLESGEVETLGLSERRTVDTRIICASNRNLKELVAEGKFREDLYYRIGVFVIEVPPLEARRDDIPVLAGEFLRRFDPSGTTRLSPEALAYLTMLPYPGNVRQLKNIIERLCILHRERTVELWDLRTDLGTTPRDKGDSGAASLADSIANFERNLIAETLLRTKGNISEAARVLNVGRANLSRKIKELGLKTE
jgi:two-component system nitrogen regulation response regulator NtrX